MPESVHLCDFPLVDNANLEPVLEQEMDLVTTVVKLGRILRAENDLKVRQPLATLHVVSKKQDLLRKVEALGDIVLDELNVKALAFGDHETNWPFESQGGLQTSRPAPGPKMKRSRRRSWRSTRMRSRSS